MRPGAWLNRRRLIAYPRIAFVAAWAVLALHLLLRDGWLGGFGQIIGSDFITLYGGGLQYRAEASRLYDLAASGAAQQALVAPTRLPGINPYVTPPNVAQAYSALTWLPLVPAFLLATAGSLLAAGAGAALSVRQIAPAWLIEAGLTTATALVVVLGWFPFVEGLLAGQNHGLTLLLLTVAAWGSLAGRPWMAGAAAGLLLYKPQFLLGFVVLWLAWRQWRALLALLAIAAAWGASVVLARGVEPFRAYLAFSGTALRLPWVPGWPGYLMVTPYGLLASLLPERAAVPVLAVAQLFGLVLVAGLGAAGIRTRAQAGPGQRVAVALALVLPLLATPYALLHDLLLLFPAFLLIAWDRVEGERLLAPAVFVYAWGILAPVAGVATGIALPALAPLAFLFAGILPAWRRLQGAGRG